jgi:anti-sigma B factor antagonist
MVYRLLVCPPVSVPLPISPVAQAGMQPFTVTRTHPAAGVTVIDPAGGLDLLSSPTLDRHLVDALRDQGCPQLILNLSHLDFCGAAGLSCLVKAGELAEQQHTVLRLVIGRRMDRLLRLTDLHSQFLTYPDLAAAVETASGAIRSTAVVGRVVRPVSSTATRVAI